MHRTARTLTHVLCSAVLAAGLLSCGQLGPLGRRNTNTNFSGTPPQPPQVTVSSVQLTQHPTATQIAARLCQEVAPALLCTTMFGGQPGEALRFAFAVNLDVQNPNTIPLPMVDILAAFTAFPGAAGQESLGAVCLQLCENGQNCPQGGADACRGGSEPEIRTLEDFAMATAGFLFAVARGEQSIDNLRIRTIPAGGQSTVTIQLELDADVVLRILQTLASDALANIRRGQPAQFSIPYRIEGSVWLRVENFGRFGTNFGPYEDRWRL